MKDATSTGESVEAPITVTPCSLLYSVREPAVADSNSVARVTITVARLVRPDVCESAAGEQGRLLRLLIGLQAGEHRAINGHLFANGNMC